MADQLCDQNPLVSDLANELSKEWKRDLQFAAIGVVSAAALELFRGVTGPVPADDRRPASRPRLSRLLLAGGLAVAYAHLVPRPDWGARSGFGFARMPVVVSAHSALGAAAPLQLGLWGALTGIALRWLQPRRF